MTDSQKPSMRVKTGKRKPGAKQQRPPKQLPRKVREALARINRDGLVPA